MSLSEIERNFKTLAHTEEGTSSCSPPVLSLKELESAELLSEIVKDFEKLAHREIYKTDRYLHFTHIQEAGIKISLMLEVNIRYH
jgi:hypothetical protein